MDTLSITVTGRIGDEPYVTTTRSGHPMVTLRLAVEVAPRTAGAEGKTRWYKVMAFGALADHAADSLHKGERVVVRADDMSTDTWLPDDGKPRGTVVLRAYDIGPSLVFDTATTGYTARKTASSAAGIPEQSPVPAEEQASPRVPAGATSGSA